jgi:hypothetical protein
MQGWIKLHRKFLKWEWYDDANTCRLFIHLLLKANHEDTKWHGIPIKRGQHLTSLKTLKKELHLSIQSIRTSFKHLKSTHEITIKATKKHSIIELVNYDVYQNTEKETNTLTNTLTNNQPTHSQHTANTKQEGKELKNEKNKIKENTKEKFSFISDPDWKSLFSEWIDYKKSQFKFTYKTKSSMKTAYDELVSLSNDDLITAKQIVGKAIASGWKGLYKVKERGTHLTSTLTKTQKNRETLKREYEKLKEKENEK